MFSGLGVWVRVASIVIKVLRFSTTFITVKINVNLGYSVYAITELKSSSIYIPSKIPLPVPTAIYSLTINGESLLSISA